MPDLDVESVERVLGIARRHGVASLRYGGLDVVFAPATRTAEQAATSQEQEPETDDARRERERRAKLEHERLLFASAEGFPDDP